MASAAASTLNDHAAAQAAAAAVTPNGSGRAGRRRHQPGNRQAQHRDYATEYSTHFMADTLSSFFLLDS
jgi:hypothetical protein